LSDFTTPSDESVQRLQNIIDEAFGRRSDFTTPSDESVQRLQNIIDEAFGRSKEE
jgi:hypothetical protein